MEETVDSRFDAPGCEDRSDEYVGRQPPFARPLVRPGLLVAVAAIGIVSLGTAVWYTGSAFTPQQVPTQSEPELDAEPLIAGDATLKQAHFDPRVELAGGELLAADADQIDDELSELQLAEAAAARGDWRDAAEA